MPATVSIVLVGSGLFEVTINETLAGAASEVELDKVVPVGTVRSVACSLLAGSATGVYPILGRVTDPAVAPVTDLVLEAVALTAPAATRVKACGSALYRATTPSATPPGARLYHRSRPNLGADNTIRTVYLIASGWR